jgi:hypothetical protein
VARLGHLSQTSDIHKDIEFCVGGGGSLTNTELSPVSMASARDRSKDLRINEGQRLGL